MELFFEKTKEAFKIAIHTPQVARCFRNLGYYFVEVEKYSEAVAALLLSKNYEEDAQQVQKLNSIPSNTGSRWELIRKSFILLIITGNIILMPDKKSQPDIFCLFYMSLQMMKRSRKC